jgi:hypothetical protein
MTELERALVALGAELEFPPTPDLTGVVRARLERRRWFRPLVFAVAAAVVGVGIALAVPPARSAILHFFHIGAATVEQVETLPPAQQRPLTAGLGPQVSRSVAIARSHVALRLPHGFTPKRFYAQPGLIATYLQYAGKPVLLAELQGNQTGLFKKFVSPGTSVEQVDIGEFGVWIHGGSHVVMWRSGYGSVRQVETRLAGDVLLWLDRGTTYRLEGELDKSQMLALARQITR